MFLVISVQPDKPCKIGPTHNGTDWMDYGLTDLDLQSVAPRVQDNHLTTLRRLYEQIRHLHKQAQTERVVSHVRRWQRLASKGWNHCLASNFTSNTPRLS